MTTKTIAALPDERDDASIEHARRAAPEDFCGRCGGPNPSWHAASPLWNAVMRAADQEPFDGIVCPSCFAFLAAEAGVTEHMCLTTHDVLVPLSTTFGDGRVWDVGLCRWVESPESALPDTGLDVEGVIVELMGAEGSLDKARERLVKATNTLARLTEAGE